MIGQLVPSADELQVMYIGFMILGGVLALFAVFIVSVRLNKHRAGKSPYTGKPLRRAIDLPFESKRQILRFLYEHQDYDNRVIALSQAVICRETGRVFQNCITWLDTVKLDWSFIQRRYPGHYVSWGSLNQVQQAIVQDAHHAIKGFQTERSCPKSSPKAVTPEFVFLKPGPLYVDLQTKVLIGWQQVPNTEFEVLIVQHPQKTIIQQW